MNDLREWFEGRSVDEEMAECYWKRVLVVLATAIVVGMILWPTEAKAEPVYQAQSEDGSIITLYTEECTLKDRVVNLPGHVTLQKGDKVIVGCWGHTNGLFLFYWDTKRVGHSSAEYFSKV